MKIVISFQAVLLTNIHLGLLGYEQKTSNFNIENSSKSFICGKFAKSVSQIRNAINGIYKIAKYNTTT